MKEQINQRCKACGRRLYLTQEDFGDEHYVECENNCSQFVTNNIDIFLKGMSDDAMERINEVLCLQKTSRESK